MSAMLVSALSAFAAVAVLSSGPAMAQHPYRSCRVARVERAGRNAVRLYVAVAYKGRVRFTHAGKGQWVDVQPPGYGFTAQLGDQVLSGDNQCLMTVTAEKGRIGVSLSGPGPHGPDTGRMGVWEESRFPGPDHVFVPAQ